MAGPCRSRLAAQATFLYGGQCQRCGHPRPVEAHWVLPPERGGADSLENLVLLCLGCHQEVHAGTGEEALLPIWALNRTALIQIGYLKLDRMRQHLEEEYAADCLLVAWCARTFARDTSFHAFHIPDARLLEELIFLRKRLGHALRTADIGKDARFALSTYENRFYRLADLLQAINDEFAARSRQRRP